MSERLTAIPASDLLDDVAEIMAVEPDTDPQPSTNHVAPEPEPKPEPVSDNPYDPARFALGNDYTKAAATRVLTKVQVRKPTREEFIRVHPDPRNRMDTQLLKDEDEFYLVSPELWPQLEGELKTVSLFLVMTIKGAVILWPTLLSSSNTWNDSALVGAKYAMADWIRLKSNKDTRCYDVWKANGKLPDPEWPDKTFGEILELAFEDKTIESMDHDVIQRLFGLTK